MTSFFACEMFFLWYQPYFQFPMFFLIYCFSFSNIKSIPFSTSVFLFRLEIMEQMALQQESAYERLYRWTQSQCRMMTSDSLDVTPTQQQAMRALQNRPVLFRLRSEVCFFFLKKDKLLHVRGEKRHRCVCSANAYTVLAKAIYDSLTHVIVKTNKVTGQ